MKTAALEKFGIAPPRLPPSLRKPFDDYERQLWTPPPALTVTQYAEKVRVLSDTESAFPGRFDCSLTPYLREPMDSLNAGHVRRCTLMFCTQHGKTTVYENLFLYLARFLPGNTMILGPDKPTAKKLSDRLRLVVKSTDDLAASLTGKPRDLSTYEYRFRRMNVFYAWAGSEASISSVPCRFGIADETGKFTRGDPIARLEKRVETYFNSFIYDCSSPSALNSAIEREFQAGDRRRWHMPCPHCSAHQVFAFWEDTADGREYRVQWPADATPDEILRHDLAFLVCKFCGATLTNAEKVALLPRGVWVPEAATVSPDGEVLGDPYSHHRSYHFSAVCSPFPNSSLSALAYDWLTAQHDPPALRVFLEDKLALPWVETIETGQPADLATLEAGYREGTIPHASPPIRVLTAGVDIQLDSAYLVVRAWNSARDSWLVRVRRLDLATPDDWNNLEAEILDTVYLDPDGRRLAVALAAIDTRYRPDEVQNFCRRHPGRLKAVFGDKGGSRIRRTVAEKNTKGKARKRTVDLWTVNSNAWKSTLAYLQTKTSWNLFRDVPAFYLDQLTAEHKVRLRVAGGERHVWELKTAHRQNHCLDAEMLALVAASLNGIYSDRPARPGAATPAGEPAASDPPATGPARRRPQPHERLARIRPHERRRKIDR